MRFFHKDSSLLFILFLALLPSVSFSQSLNANWGCSNLANFIKTDPSGNLLATSFADSLLTKMDANGHVLWKVDFPVQPNDSTAIVQGLAVDANGNSYIVGSYQTTQIIFGTTTLTADTSRGHSSLFLTTYDADGNFRWAITTATNSTARAIAIQVNNSGEIFISGDLDTASAVFGSTTLQSGVFHVKINADKSIAWAKAIHADGQIFAGGMDVDASGNSIVAGNFTGATCSIGSVSLTNSNAATSDIFILQFDTNGNMGMSQINGTAANNDWLSAMDLGASGSLYITGRHENGSVFIKAYDVFGNYIWENHYYNSSRTYYSVDLNVDAQENVYVAGVFYSAEMDIDTVTLTVSGSSDATFVAKFNKNGHLLWAGEKDNSFTNHILASADGNVYLTAGIISATLTFGSVIITNRNSPNGDDGYLVQLNQNTPVTGIFSSLSSQQTALLYPNPTNGNISISGLQTAQWNLSIYSMTGNAVYQTKFNNSQINIDLSAYPKGFYFYELQNDAAEMRTGKISLE